MATSVALGWDTVTVTVSAPTAHGDAERPQRRDPLGGEPGGGARVGGHGGRPGGLASRQLDGQLVAADERHLQHPEQEHHHHRQRQRQLDGGLPGVASACRIGPHTLSMTESMTRSNSRPTLAAPPPAVAQPTTSRATSAAASSTRAYSVVA